VLDRRVEDGLRARKADDLVELARDLGAPHAQDGPVEEDVLAALRARDGSRSRRRAGCRRGADDLQFAFGRLGDQRDDLRNSVGLARPLWPMMPIILARADVEADVAERP
jgi:hypothetical protein